MPQRISFSRIFGNSSKSHSKFASEAPTSQISENSENTDPGDRNGHAVAPPDDFRPNDLTESRVYVS